MNMVPQAPVAELVLPPVNEGAPPFMPSWEDRYEEAHRHVTNGLYVIERQRILIERQKSLGAYTKRSEELLSQFERSRVIFEEDLDRVILQRN